MYRLSLILYGVMAVEKRKLLFTVLPILARRPMHHVEKDLRKVILIRKATQSCDLVDGFIRHAEQIRGGLNPNLRQILIDGYAVFFLKGAEKRSPATEKMAAQLIDGKFLHVMGSQEDFDVVG